MNYVNTVKIGKKIRYIKKGTYISRSRKIILGYSSTALHPEQQYIQIQQR